MIADKRLFLILLATNICGGLAAVWTLQVNILGIDDAYIYFVYAKNFLLSGEFVYNLGGERVEGFSSPLWMAACIVAAWLSPEPQIPLYLLASLLATCITYLGVRYTETVIVAQRSARATVFLHIGSWLFLAALFANPSWFTWNLGSLMETPLWGALIFGVLMQLIHIVRRGSQRAHDPWLFAALIALLILCRPEAPLWTCWYLVAYGATLRAIGQKPSAIIMALLPAISAGLAAAALLFGARLTYFGYLFANTYYAKMSPNLGYNLTEGLFYLLRFCAQNGIAVLGVLAAGWAASKTIYLLLPTSHNDQAKVRNDTELGLLAGTVAAGIAAALITGGDKFGGYRFYQSFVPILYLLILQFGMRSYTRLGAQLIQPVGWINGLAIAALAGLVLTTLITASWSNHNRTNLQIEFRIAEQMRQSARLMNHIFTSIGTPLPRVAVIPAGGFKLDAEAETFDLMGLNWVAMAHSEAGREGIKSHAAFDPAIFWAARPQILGARRCGFESAPWKPERFEWRVLKGLPGTDRFTEAFSYAHLRVKGEIDWLCGYMENDWISSLRANPNLEIHTYEEHETDSHLQGVAPEKESIFNNYNN